MTHPQPTLLYEDEIDVRDIVRFLWRARWWAFGMALAALVLAFGALHLRPTYRALAQIRLDISNTPQLPRNVRGLDQVVVADSWLKANNVYRSDRGYRALLLPREALLTLEVTAPTPDQAQATAQAWAEAVVAWLHEQDQAFLQETVRQEQEAYQRYQAAQKAWEDFLAQDPRVSLQQQAKRLEQEQMCALKQLAHFQALYEDLQTLSKAPSGTLDTLVLLALQQRAVAAPPCGGTASFTLQLGVDDLVALDDQARKAFLARLTQYAKARISQAEETLARTQVDLQDVNARLAQAEFQAEKLRLEREKARDAWIDLYDKRLRLEALLAQYPPARIEAPATSGKPAFSPLTVSFVSAVVGGMMGVFLFGFREMLREPESSEEAPASSS